MKTEDVDATAEIKRLPEDDFVVLRSRDYLMATRIVDWRIVRVFLGQEWVRSTPVEWSQFAAPSPARWNNGARREKGCSRIGSRGNRNPIRSASK